MDSWECISSSAYKMKKKSYGNTMKYSHWWFYFMIACKIFFRTSTFIGICLTGPLLILVEWPCYRYSSTKDSGDLPATPPTVADTSLVVPTSKCSTGVINTSNLQWLQKKVTKDSVCEYVGTKQWGNETRGRGNKHRYYHGDQDIPKQRCWIHI